MAFDPSFIEELKNRVSITDVVGRKVSWDKGRSNPSRGDWWACCPFHNETTPSFHVMERDGYYKCFGCGAKGGVFDFVMETENVSFPEAVELIAQEAGVALPERGPQDRARRAAQAQLGDVMQAAVTEYRRALFGARGEAALAYLRRRGLSDATIERFELGYALDARDGLTRRLRETGASADALAKAGLSGRDDNRPDQLYDRFRDRVMFPIRDPRGRCIGFGGRAMSAKAKAKYINTSDTPLFSKGRVLYNHGPARAAAGASGELIVAEGYMDVIALAQAGFEGAVAPLGTALTEDQLALLWRMADEPIIALDGDKAGLAAAARAMDLALPRLEPGKSLRFALMPPDQDPDDVLGAKDGVEVMRAILDAAAPLADMLWRRETEGWGGPPVNLATPERKAAFERRLQELTQAIQNPEVRRQYEFDLKDRRFRFYRERRESAGGASAGRRRPRWDAPPPPSPEALAAAGDPLNIRRPREAALIALLLSRPDVAETLQEEVARVVFACAELDAARRALADALADAEACADSGRLRAAVAERCGPERLQAVDRLAAPRLAALRAPARAAEDENAAHVAAESVARSIRGDWLLYVKEFGLRAESDEYASEAVNAVFEAETDAEDPFTERLRVAIELSRAENRDEAAPTDPAAQSRKQIEEFLNAQPWKKGGVRAR